MTGRAPMFEPIAFADIAGWADDDHAGALRALVRGAPSLDVTSGAGAPGFSHDLRRWLEKHNATEPARLESARPRTAEPPSRRKRN